MRKTFETEEFDVDYIVLFGDENLRPEDHYRNRKSKREVYNTVEEAREKAECYSNARVWEVAHATDSGDIVFTSEV